MLPTAVCSYPAGDSKPLRLPWSETTIFVNESPLPDDTVRAGVTLAGTAAVGFCGLSLRLLVAVPATTSVTAAATRTPNTPNHLSCLGIAPSSFLATPPH